MSDPTPLVNHVYQMWIDEQLQHTRNKGALPPEMHAEESFRSLYKESTFKLTGYPLHNQHINYYNHLSEAHRDTTPIHLPSKLFWFRYMKESITCEDQPKNNTVPDCVMWIEQPSTPVKKALLSTCVRISEIQPVTDLCMSSVRCKGWPASNLFKISESAQSVTLNDCTLPSSTMNPLNNLIHLISDLEPLEIYRIWPHGPSTDIGCFHVKFSASGGQTTNMASVESKNHTLQKQPLIHLMQGIQNVIGHDEETISVHPLTANVLLINKTSIEFHTCTLPSQTQNHLMQQINRRHRTRKIIFQGTRLRHVSYLTLKNKISLSHLELSGTDLLQEVWQNVCSQLKNLLHLEYIELSNNNLSIEYRL